MFWSIVPLSKDSLLVTQCQGLSDRLKVFTGVERCKLKCHTCCSWSG